MTRPRVLQVGMDPAVIDFSPWPGQDADQLRVRIDEATAMLRNAGFDATVCLLSDDPADTESTLAECFATGKFDVVEIGSGVRNSSKYTIIFERVVNTVHVLQPGIRFCFNESPETTLDAVRRALET